MRDQMSDEEINGGERNKREREKGKTKTLLSLVGLKDYHKDLGVKIQALRSHFHPSFLGTPSSPH